MNTERYLIADTLIAWYGSQKKGRNLQGLSVFTQTTDTFNPDQSAKRFRDWLVCCQSASGVSGLLVGTGPAGCFDSLLQSHQPLFEAGNLIACPVWQYRVSIPGTANISDIGPPPGPAPDLNTIICKLGI